MATLAVDLLFLTGRRGGTETYAREVLTRLPEHLDVDLVGIVNRQGAEIVPAWFPGRLERLDIDGDNRLAWAVAEVARVQRRAAGLDADLLWCPSNYGPRASRVPSVVTLHDVIPLEQPARGAALAAREVSRVVIGRAARSARRLITGSEDARTAIGRVLGIGPERISVIPDAATPPAGEVDPGSITELALPTGRPLLLSTGNRMPHKNFDGLLRALATLPAARRPHLVVTGSHGDDPLRPIVAELGLSADVTLLGWVTRGQLEALFQRCDLYLCPSLAEGFGLPVLDAMLRSRPVLAHDLPVLREVGGAAARYADATDPYAFGAAISELLNDAAGRELLAVAGRERAAQFTWERTARATATVLRRAIDGPPGDRA